MKKEEKKPIVNDEIIFLERAMHLKLLNERESEFISDLSELYKTRGSKMLITGSQRTKLVKLSKRFAETWNLRW